MPIPGLSDKIKAIAQANMKPRPFCVVVATPTTGVVKSDYAVSLARLVAYLAQVTIGPDVQEQAMDFLVLEGSGISGNREKMVDAALAKPDMTHILWLDDDMGFNADILHILASHKKPIVGCNYRMRAPPGDFTALSMDKVNRIQTTEESSGLEEAYYCGFGACLIERQVFEKMEFPRYPLMVNHETHEYSTEDSPFFRQARELGFKCYIDHDASKRIWHFGSIRYQWNKSYKEL